MGGGPGPWAHGPKKKTLGALGPGMSMRDKDTRNTAGRKGQEKEGPRKRRDPEKEGPRTRRGYKRKSIRKEKPREKELTMELA